MSTPDTASPRASRARLFAALPRMSGTAIALRNRAYQAAPTMLSDERIFIWQETAATSTIGELACRVGDWQLAISADNLARIEPRLEGFESFVPTDTCAALVEHALSPVLTLLERLLGVPVECNEFRRGAAASVPADEVRVGFVVLEANLQPVLRGWVRTTPDAWHQMDFSRAIRLPSQRSRVVPVRLSMGIGGCRLSLRELRALAVGDALRSTPRIDRHAGSLPITLTDVSVPGASKFSILARVADDNLSLEYAVTTTTETTADTSAPETQLDGTDNTPQNDLIDDIQCDVSFELGSLRMTVADIGRLRTGQSMRLGVRLQEQPVRVMVNGRWIARGELAAVGDELVVVITDTSRLPQV
jgi:type III secretion system YscQ/HrcQ family protein